MKTKISSIFWGCVLILAGGALLAEKLGYLDFEKIPHNAWVYIFTAASLVFFFSYFLNGVRKWGWLFPALIGAALALTIWMADRRLDGATMGTPILLSVGLPFYVGFAVDRRSWGLLIPAWVMTILALITLLVDRINGNLIGALFLFSVALPFLVVYLMDRTRRWALIPAWVTTILGLITLLAERVNGNLIGALFLFSAALPFLVVYLMDRTRRWALIPACAIAIVGTLPLLASFVSDNAMGAVVMFVFALPFFAYFRVRGGWWALIPAGIFTSIGLVVVLSVFVPENQGVWSGILNGILLLGFGLTFGVLWLRRGTQPTDWAKYPAVGLLAASLLAFILGKNIQEYWAAVLMVVGILLIVTGLLPKKNKEPRKPAE